MTNEKRLIDANALLEDFGEEPMVWNDDEAEIQERNDWRMYRGKVENAPTVDAVEVVRCKDCKHLGFKGLCDGVCNRKMVGIVNPDDFCSYGERKDNG
jgi:hypothetical protein